MPSHFAVSLIERPSTEIAATTERWQCQRRQRMTISWSLTVSDVGPAKVSAIRRFQSRRGVPAASVNEFVFHIA
jgi:hypothetical protein